MKKIFILAMLMSPMAAGAIDLSDCEKIGYWQNTNTTCQMYDDCVANQPLGEVAPDEVCAAKPRTAGECEYQIAQENADAAEKAILIACPPTDARLADKNADKDFEMSGFKIVSFSGDDKNIDEVFADSVSVYYLKAPVEISKQVAGDTDSWLVIGGRGEDGVYVGVVK